MNPMPSSICIDEEFNIFCITSWDTQFHRDIHVVANWLNLAFQNDLSTLNKRLETQSVVTNVIESKVISGRLKLVEELELFLEREQNFGTQLTLEMGNTS